MTCWSCDSNNITWFLALSRWRTFGIPAGLDFSKSRDTLPYQYDHIWKGWILRHNADIQYASVDSRQSYWINQTTMSNCEKCVLPVYKFCGIVSYVTRKLKMLLLKPRWWRRRRVWSVSLARRIAIRVSFNSMCDVFGSFVFWRFFWLCFHATRNIKMASFRVTVFHDVTSFRIQHGVTWRTTSKSANSEKKMKKKMWKWKWKKKNHIFST